MKTVITKRIIQCALLIAALSVPLFATDVNYTINFTTTSGEVAPTGGTFTYDASTGTFSNFTVGWDGYTFDMTAAAMDPFIEGLCDSESTPSGFVGFEIMSQNCGGSTSPRVWQAIRWYNPFIDPYPPYATSGWSFTFEQSSPVYDWIHFDNAPPAQCGPCSSPVAQGSWTIAAATPEPGTYVLSSIGLGLLMLMRKRLVSAFR